MDTDYKCITANIYSIIMLVCKICKKTSFYITDFSEKQPQFCLVSSKKIILYYWKLNFHRKGHHMARYVVINRSVLARTKIFHCKTTRC